MLRRALLAAVAFSYLICVLIMSGMQKEDLEISMLRKLQRYNVNIDDMNNEKLRKECTLRNGDSNGIKIDKTNDSYVSTTEKISTVSTEVPLSQDLNMEEVLYRLKVQQDSLINQTQEKYYHTQQAATFVSEYLKDKPKSDLDLLQRYIQIERAEKSVNKHDSQVGTSLNMKHNFNMEEKNPNTFKQITFVNKAFTDYFIQNQIRFTTTSFTTTSRTVDIRNIYKKIDELIGSNSSNKEKEISPENNSRNYNNIKGVIQEEHNNYNNRTIYDFLTMMNQFKPYFSLDVTQNNTSQLPYHQNHNTLSETISQKNIVEYKEITTNKPEPIVALQQKALPPNFVQEIAESVKAAIIKDLRKELSNIYFKPTTITTSITTTVTTTATPTTTTLKIFSQEKAIMDTFMELYEKIKDLKLPTVILEAHNKSENSIHVPKEEIKSLTIKPPFVMNRLSYPQTKVISAFDSYNTMQVSNINKYFLPSLYNQVPKTIQTNSVEIRPLVVPLTKPETLIRQNIIVKPKRDFQDNYEHRMQQFIPNKGRHSEVRNNHNRTSRYDLMKQYEGYNAANNPIHYNYQHPIHNKEDVVRFRLRHNGDSIFDTDYYEKMHLGNLDVGHNEKKTDIENRNHFIPRFHERLERVDDGMLALPGAYNLNKDDTYRTITHKDIKTQDKTNDDVTSRQQLSLIDMKKGSNYDDTHFKNFLKTQQKVTDILERILANGPKNNMPKSVETA